MHLSNFKIPNNKLFNKMYITYITEFYKTKTTRISNITNRNIVFVLFLVVISKNDLDDGFSARCDGY